MTKSESRITGFIDGYKAQNIASSAASLQFHWEEIERLLKAMIESHEVCEDEEAEINYQRLADFLSRIGDDDTIKKSTKFGEAIKTFVQEAGPSRKKILLNMNFRRLALQFLELAEIAADKRVVDIAVELGELVSS